jgi:glycosyltransferase EpsH
MPKVSIIVPIYNKERYLEKSITSILNQTLIDLEVILVNDGSFDNSLDICNKFSSQDKRIKVIDQKNGGVSVARNTGLAKAKGEYIAFLDPDDWVEQNMYSSMYNNCVETGSEICICNYYKDSGEAISPVTMNLTNHILNKNEIINEIILNMLAPKDINSRNNSMMGNVWRLLIKKELIDEYSINFPPGIPLMEDLIFCLKAFTKTKKICIDRGHFYHYCIQEDSASIVYRENRLELLLGVMKIIESLLEEEDLYHLSKQRLNNRYVNLAISAIINEAHKSNPYKSSKKIEKIKRICALPEVQKALELIDTNGYTLRKRVTLKAMKRKNALYLLFYYRLANL